MDKARLSVQLKTAQDNYAAMKDNTEYRIHKLHTEVDFYTGQNKSLVTELETLQPDYEQLCLQHDQKLKEFNRTKTELFSMWTHLNRILIELCIHFTCIIYFRGQDFKNKYGN